MRTEEGEGAASRDLANERRKNGGEKTTTTDSMGGKREPSLARRKKKNTSKDKGRLPALSTSRKRREEKENGKEQSISGMAKSEKKRRSQGSGLHSGNKERLNFSKISTAADTVKRKKEKKASVRTLIRQEGKKESRGKLTSFRRGEERGGTQKISVSDREERSRREREETKTTKANPRQRTKKPGRAA